MYKRITDKTHQRNLLIVIAAAIFIDSLDGSIVNIALPTIASDFSVDISMAAWVIMAYFLFLVGLIPLFGKIADHGRLQEIFNLGFFVFTIGSVFCALSPDLMLLNISRGIQGVGASMIAVISPLLIVRLLPKNHWGMGMGVTATAGAVALAFGPVLGGFLTEYLSWHWCFIINVPIGVVAILAGFKFIPKACEKPDKINFDLPGSVLIFASIASIIYVLERGGVIGWTDPSIIISGVLFIAATLGFIIHELRTHDPILNIRVFQSLPFSLVTLAYFLISIVYAGFLYIIPFYMSIVLGYSPAVSGLVLLISSIITALIGFPSGMLSDRIGSRWLVTVAGVIRVLFCLIMAVMIPEYGFLWILLLMILSGLTFGISGGPSAARVVEHAPDEEGGTGSVILMICQYSGMVIGVALYALVFNMGLTFADTPVNLLTASEFLTGYHLTGWLGVFISIFVVIVSVAVKDTLIKKCED